jgi:hypothetical protein
MERAPAVPVSFNGSDSPAREEIMQTYTFRHYRQLAPRSDDKQSLIRSQSFPAGNPEQAESLANGLAEGFDAEIDYAELVDEKGRTVWSKGLRR